MELRNGLFKARESEGRRFRAHEAEPLDAGSQHRQTQSLLCNISRSDVAYTRWWNLLVYSDSPDIRCTHSIKSDRLIGRCNAFAFESIVSLATATFLELYICFYCVF